MINALTTRFTLFACLLLTVAATHAETVYVTDQIKVGLHEEKLLDSPIIKVITSGAALEVIKREENVTFVKDLDGTSGWIDNSYLLQASPDTRSSRISMLESELADAKQQIRNLQRQTPDATNNNDLKTLQQENEELQQKFNTEKLNAGELRVQLAELRKRLGQDNDSESLYAKIDELVSEKKELEIKLAAAMEINDENGNDGSADKKNGVVNNWKDLLLYLGIALFIGICAGIYIIDLINRKRHGGFRV